MKRVPAVTPAGIQMTECADKDTDDELSVSIDPRFELTEIFGPSLIGNYRSVPSLTSSCSGTGTVRAAES